MRRWKLIDKRHRNTLIIHRDPKYCYWDRIMRLIPAKNLETTSISPFSSWWRWERSLFIFCFCFSSLDVNILLRACWYDNHVWLSFACLYLSEQQNEKENTCIRFRIQTDHFHCYIGRPVNTIVVAPFGQLQRLKPYWKGYPWDTSMTRKIRNTRHLPIYCLTADWTSEENECKPWIIRQLESMVYRWDERQRKKVAFEEKKFSVFIDALSAQYHLIQLNFVTASGIDWLVNCS